MKSYSRPRQNYPGEWVDFQSVKLLGSGGFGCVTELREVCNRMQVVSHPKRHVRVAKSIKFETTHYDKNGNTFIHQNYSSYAKFIAAVESEYKYAHRAPHLHVKPPVQVSGNEYLLIMEKMRGEKLEDIIKKINENKIQLSAKEYLSLMIEIVRAVQFEIDDCYMFHRDIKHNNLMVELRYPAEPKAKMLDYGLARGKEESVESKYVGTGCFAAPEVFFDKAPYTEQSDIFSLGITCLALVIKNLNWDLVKDHKRSIGDSFWEDYKVNDSRNFRFRDELSPIEPQLKEVISIMCATKNHDRTNLNFLEAKLHAIRLKLNYPQALPEEISRLKNIQQHALELRKALKKPVILINANKRICDALAQVPDVASDVKEFISTLGIKALYGCTSHSDVRDRTNNVAIEYRRNCDNLAKIIIRLKNTKRSNYDSDEYLNILINKQKKYDKAKHISYDKLSHASKKIGRLVEYAPVAFLKLFPGLNEESSLYKMVNRYAYTTKVNSREYKSFKREWEIKAKAEARDFFKYKLNQLNDLKLMLEMLTNTNKNKTFSCWGKKQDAISAALEEINDQLSQFSLMSDGTKSFTKEQYEAASHKLSEILQVMRVTMRTLVPNQDNYSRAGFFGRYLIPTFVKHMFDEQAEQVKDQTPENNVRYYVK